MRILLIVLPLLAGSGLAQDHSGGAQKQAPKPGDSQTNSAAVRRLEAVTWNPVTEELTWQVSVWNTGAGVDKPSAVEHYLIHLDAATMAVNGELRGFSQTEAKRVHVLMDMMSTYAVESTVWWDLGQGDPIDPKKAPAAKPGESPRSKPDGDANREKNDNDKKDEKPKETPKSNPNLLRGAVARNAAIDSTRP
jgi:hypothetical protein